MFENFNRELKSDKSNMVSGFHTKRLAKLITHSNKYELKNKYIKNIDDVLHNENHSNGVEVAHTLHKKYVERKRQNSWKTRRRKRNVNEYFHTENNNLSNKEEVDVFQKSASTKCLHPEYLVYTWVLSLIALATTLKLYFLIKTFLAIAMVAIYSLFILVFYPDVFSNAHVYEL